MWRSCQLYLEIFKNVVLGAVAPRTSTPGNWRCITIIYLYLENIHIRDAERCAVWSFASTHVENTTSSRTVLYMVFFYCICTQCVSLFHIKHRFTTHTMLEWTKQLFIEQTWQSLFSLLELCYSYKNKMLQA